MDNTKNTFVGLRHSESSHSLSSAPIATHFDDCQESFRKLSTTMKNQDCFEGCQESFSQLSTTTSNRETQQPSSISLDGFYSRFRQWGLVTGASNRSLDYALRKSSRLQDSTIDLLKDLLWALNTARDSLQEASVPSNSPAPRAPDMYPDPSDHLNSSKSSSESGISFQQCTGEIEQIIECLMKLIPTLQDPVPNDIYQQHASQSEANQDIALAAKMFPQATPELIRRLGYANWKRRQFFQESKSQNDNINWPEKDVQYDRQRIVVPHFDSISDVLEPDYRVVFSSQRTYTGDSSDIGSPSVVDSIFSKPKTLGFSSASSVSGSDQFVRLKVPQPPVVLKSDSSFDCPYCSQEITFGAQIASEEDWAQHVYMDLEPYLCTFDNCIRADKSFGICEEWFQHELDSHRLKQVWSCHSCALEFNKKPEIEKHLGENHKAAVDASDLSIMVSLCERYSQQTQSAQECPCCKHLIKPLNTLKKHLADHLEQFALSSVPSNTIDLEDFLSGMFWQPAEDETSNLNPLFAEDSDDEKAHRTAEMHEEIVEVVSRGTTKNVRPPIQRRGDSWMKKVETFLDKQPTNEVENESSKPKFDDLLALEKQSMGGAENDSWKPRVEDFLENQFIHEQLLMKSETDLIGNPSAAVVASRSLRLPDPSIRSLPIRTKPPPRNDDFTGRASDLSRLHAILSIPGSMFILSGAGGMGKTAAANEYTYRYEESYKYIFWVSAETSMSCADTYSIIATQLDLLKDDSGVEQSRLITQSRDFLEHNKERWLLVFDNAISWLDIKNFIPTHFSKTRGSILITSRKFNSEGLALSPKCFHVELGPLALEESRKLLLLSMQPNLDVRRLRLHPEYEVAGEIAILAERKPLALAHIAGYVQVSKCTLTEFVQLWNERYRYTWRSSSTAIPSSMSTDKVFETVWSIGLHEVTTDARELLDILGFLDSETIQRKLLVGEHEEPSLEFLHSDQTFRYKRMITELSRRRLIEVINQDGEEALRIHRSLQQKILHDLNRNARKLEEVFSQAFDLVRKRFPLPSPIQVPEPSKWPACKDLLSHVLHFQHLAMDQLPSLIPSVKLARLLSDGGINLWERGMTNEGLRLLRSAETILDKLRCEENQLRASIHIIIALLIQDHGLVFVKESRDRIWKALQIRKDYMKQTQPSSYTRNDDILLHNAWSDFGCVLLQYGKYNEAEPIFESCAAKYQEWGTVTEIPYEYYKFNHHTAFCRLYHLDFEAAIRLAEESLRCITLATGQSSATNKTMFDLACIILQSGDIMRALDLHNQVLEWRLKFHGSFSFLTLRSYYAVGALNVYAGNIVDGERLMREALKLEYSRPGSFPEAAFARTQFHLSQVLTEKGAEHQVEAQQLATEARKVLQKTTPLEPLHIIDVKDELALFDYLQPIFDGRFTGRSLLRYVSAKK